MNPKPKTFIFTLTSGRSGTKYLAHLFPTNFPQATVFHEMIGYHTFGVNTPDLSHFTTFNSQGNTDKIKAFWRQKFKTVSQTPSTLYIETSHLLMKAGLVENLSLLTPHGQVYLIALHRDTYSTAVSFKKRLTFFNLGSIWLWTLDPNYPKNIVSPKPFLEKLSQHDVNVLWHLYEIKARVEYSRLLTQPKPKIQIIDINLNQLNQPSSVKQFFSQLHLNKPQAQITLPPHQNVSSGGALLTPQELHRLRTAIDTLNLNPKTLAQTYLQNGNSFEPKS